MVNIDKSVHKTYPIVTLRVTALSQSGTVADKAMATSATATILKGLLPLAFFDISWFSCEFDGELGDKTKNNQSLPLL